MTNAAVCNSYGTDHKNVLKPLETLQRKNCTKKASRIKDIETFSAPLFLLTCFSKKQEIKIREVMISSEYAADRHDWRGKEKFMYFSAHEVQFNKNSWPDCQRRFWEFEVF